MKHYKLEDPDRLNPPDYKKLQAPVVPNTKAVNNITIARKKPNFNFPIKI